MTPSNNSKSVLCFKANFFEFRVSTSSSEENIFFNMGLFRPVLDLYLILTSYNCRLQLINFTMVNYDRKQERKRKSMQHSIITCYYKKPHTHWEWIDRNSELKTRSVPRFEPRLPRENAIALSLVSPPLPAFWRKKITIFYL